MLVPSVKPTVGFYIYRRQDQKLHRCLIIKRCQHQLCTYIFPACCIFLIKFFLLFFSIRRTLLKPTSEALWTWWGPAWERGRRWSAWSWHRRSPPCSTTAGRRCKAATMGICGGGRVVMVRPRLPRYPAQPPICKLGMYTYTFSSLNIWHCWLFKTYLTVHLI